MPGWSWDKACPSLDGNTEPICKNKKADTIQQLKLFSLWGGVDFSSCAYTISCDEGILVSSQLKNLHSDHKRVRQIWVRPAVSPHAFLNLQLRSCNAKSIPMGSKAAKITFPSNRPVPQWGLSGPMHKSRQEADHLVSYKLTQDYQKEQQLDLEFKSSVLTIRHMAFKKVNPNSFRQDFSNLHLRFSLTRCSD